MGTQLMIPLGMVALVLVAFLVGIWACVKATKSHWAKPKFARGMVTPLRSGEARKRHRLSDYRQKRTKGQRDFLTDPNDAIPKADQLVHEIMRKRGYPITKIW